MRELGFEAYRFFAQWSRMMPDRNRTGQSKGAGFLCTADRWAAGSGIAPWLTLYPLGSASGVGGWGDGVSRGGRLVRRLRGYGLRQVRRSGEALGDSQRAVVYFVLGYCIGRHAPGIQDWSAALRAAHHAHLAHRAAVDGDPRGGAGRADRHRAEPPPRRAGDRDRCGPRGRAAPRRDREPLVPRPA